jgi:hypothetical protein
MIIQERRSNKREHRKLSIRYSCPSRKNGTGGTSITENLSLGGVYFRSFEQFSPGDILDCKIFLPEENVETRWTARVVRCDRKESGMVPVFGIAAEFNRSFGPSEKILKKIFGLIKDRQ